MSTPLPKSPFLPDPPKFELDEERFLRDIGVKPYPVFLSDPSWQYLELLFDFELDDLIKQPKWTRRQS